MHVVTAPAKINLGLEVLRRRPDGFHDIRTIFVRIPWSDRITVSESDSIAFTCTDPALPTDDDNLCVRAARALAASTGVDRGAHIFLEKRIPYGAGLGGGSSDAASTLGALSKLWKLDLSAERLTSIATTIGSDVAFFLGPPAAVGEGRGELLSPFRQDNGTLYRMPFPLCVVVPSVEVATGEAYALVAPRGGRDVAAMEQLEDVVRTNDLGRWGSSLRNDFEGPILKRHPTIAAAKQMLVDAGAGFSSLSGSGSSVFGVFENEEQCRAASEAADLAGHRTWWGYAES